MANTIKKKFDEVVPIDKQYFKVRQGSLWGATDSTGKLLSECKYPNICSVTSEGVCCEIDDDVYFFRHAV